MVKRRMMNKQELKGKRIGSLDYGRKRIGFAVCDELHITVSTRGVFFKDTPDYFEKLVEAINSERLSAIVVGEPVRNDGIETDLQKEINEFADNLNEKTGLAIYRQDESFSSKRAVSTMLEIGFKKKKRRDKANTDTISAAIILRDFLETIG
ncbi:MAG: Holliday junction resolvase YqgF [Ignavibacteria bacterium]|nr:Holliday junction resolvase YqgF [Ignavibacteria bacterium]